MLNNCMEGTQDPATYVSCKIGIVLKSSHERYIILPYTVY